MHKYILTFAKKNKISNKLFTYISKIICWILFLMLIKV